MNSVGAILSAQYEQRLAACKRIFDSNRTSSIEFTGNKLNSNNSIEHYLKGIDQTVQIPAEIDELIDDKRFRGKYAAMIANGFKEQLLELVRYTRSMEAAGKLRKRPCEFFAGFAKYSTWGDTLKLLAALKKARQQAERVAEKIGATVTAFIFQQIWKGINVESLGGFSL